VPEVFFTLSEEGRGACLHSVDGRRRLCRLGGKPFILAGQPLFSRRGRRDACISLLPCKEKKGVPSTSLSLGSGGGKPAPVYQREKQRFFALRGDLGAAIISSGERASLIEGGKRGGGKVSSSSLVYEEERALVVKRVLTSE